MRKKPIRHKVKSHTRNGSKVNSFMRGNGPKKISRKPGRPKTKPYDYNR